MKNEKILVVEFEENSLNSLLQLLQGEGFEVVTAKDGHEGLLKFESESPDLVILEPMLLKLHGFDLCRKITQDSPKKTPVVITTGFYKGEHYKSEAIETFGASAFFEKPYQNEELLTTIHDLLGNGTGKPVEKVKESIQEAEVDMKSAKESVKEMEENFEELEVPPAEEEEHEEMIMEEVAEGDSEGDEVSKEVDAMLKSALSEFGLNIDKKKVERDKGQKKEIKEEEKEVKEKSLEEDVTKVEVKSLETEHVEEVEEAGEEEEGEGEELKTEELIEELIRKEEHVEEEDKTEEGMVLTESEQVTRGEEELYEEVEEEVKEEVKEEMKEEVKEETEEEVDEGAQEPGLEEILQQEPQEEKQDPDNKVFEEYFEQTEKPASFRLNFFGFLKKIKKPLPIKIGSSVFVILVAAGATYYFLKPGKAPTVLKQENSKIVSDVQRTTSDPSEESFNSQISEKQQEPEQKVSPLSAAPEGSESDKPQIPASSEAPPANEPAAESTTEFAAPTKLSSRERQVMLPSISEAPGSRNFEVIEVEDTKEARVETSELAVSLPQLEETAKKIIQPEDATDRIKTGDLVPIESVDILPVAERKVNPKYPPSAFQRGIEATVEFRTLISEFGNVLDIAFVDSGSMSVFHKACEEAVKQWKFSPAKKNGVNVKVWKTFSIAFKKKNME